MKFIFTLYITRINTVNNKSNLLSVIINSLYFRYINPIIKAINKIVKHIPLQLVKKFFIRPGIEHIHIIFSSAVITISGSGSFPPNIFAN